MKKKQKAKTGTVEPPSLSERLVVALESIARSLRHAHEPIISGTVVDVKPIFKKKKRA